MQNEILTFLRREYGLEVSSVCRMTTGVGGDTFRVTAAQGSFVFKIVKADDINHPEQEAALCTFLREHGIPTSEFLPDRQGRLVSRWEDGRVCHVQRLIEGKPFPMNAAEDWFMAQSPALLGRIHEALAAYAPLPEGIGQGFFTHMTPETALQSYGRSLELARSRGEEAVCEALSVRIRLARKHAAWRIDPAGLTCVNTHGDFTVNQILVKDGCITGVIDWTSACVHPAVWELTRSYFYAAPECADGRMDEARFRAWVRAYEARCPLNAKDRALLMDVYLYQLLVCDYYTQYLHAAPHEAAEFRQQADFATRVLQNAL